MRWALFLSMALIVACSSPQPQPIPTPPDRRAEDTSVMLEKMYEALEEAIAEVESRAYEEEEEITEKKFEYVQEMRDQIEEIEGLLECTQYDIEELLKLKKRLKAKIDKCRTAENLPFSQRWREVFSEIEYATQDLRELLGEE
jgi:hypothetical protein